MLNLNVSFDGKAEKLLRKAKEESGMSWAKFILVSAGIDPEEATD